MKEEPHTCDLHYHGIRENCGKVYEVYVCEIDSYMYVGQHGSADIGIVNTTKLATPEEYNGLKRELEDMIGYNLLIKKRISNKSFKIRAEQIRGIK